MFYSILGSLACCLELFYAYFVQCAAQQTITPHSIFQISHESNLMSLTHTSMGYSSMSYLAAPEISSSVLGEYPTAQVINEILSNLYDAKNVHIE